jgi:phosphate transport system substrate-binding protein
MPSKFLKITTVAAVIAAGFSASSAIAAEKIIKIDGSSTVYPITEAVAEDFQKAQKVKVTVGESGTGGGFKKFCINNKLRHNSMVEIVKGRRKSYHGWTVEYVKE